jgi:hypothetical protein
MFNVAKFNAARRHHMKGEKSPALTTRSELMVKKVKRSETLSSVSPLDGLSFVVRSKNEKPKKCEPRSLHPSLKRWERTKATDQQQDHKEQQQKATTTTANREFTER